MTIKQFGKLTLEQIRQLLPFMAALLDSRADYLAEIRESPDKLQEITTVPLSWCEAYELPIEEHIAYLAYGMGQAETVIQFSQADDPQQEVINSLHSDESENDQPIASPQELLELVEALCCSFRCLITYGRYIHDIIQDVKLRTVDSDAWLFKAIRIDPSVITSPTTQDRLSRALLVGDDKFVQGLQKALAQKTGKPAAYLNQFRFLMKLLEDCGVLFTMPDAQIADLILSLGIYTDSPNAKHNLNELVRKHKKTKAHFKSQNEMDEESFPAE